MCFLVQSGPVFALIDSFICPQYQVACVNGGSRKGDADGCSSNDLISHHRTENQATINPVVNQQRRPHNRINRGDEIMTINLSHSCSVISGAENLLTRAPGNKVLSLQSSAFNNDISSLRLLIMTLSSLSLDTIMK